MPPGILVCPYCKRKNFASKRGLTQHQTQNVACNKRMKQSLGMAKNRTGFAHDFLQTVNVNRTYGRQLTGGVAATVGRIQQETRATLPQNVTIPQNSGVIDKTL